MISLPVDDFVEDILADFQGHQNMVLVAEPGAGKTTRVPPQLLKICQQKVLVLEPRRMAALAAASRIAEEQNWVLGQNIGYQVRFDSLVSDNTRLIFMTEALLAKKILQDQDLKDVDIVVLDEFHERSQHVDLALGLLKEAQELGSKVKILVMSATLEAESISKFLGGAPIVRVPGVSFPLDIRYDKFPQSLRTDDSFINRVIDKIKEAQRGSSKDILVFLPGVGEIQRCARALGNFSIKVDILHGSLDLAEQRRVLKKSSDQRVILATNIAESSVTLDGVGVVVDSGLNRINSWNVDTGFETLALARVSQSSATQRAGRAARQGPGVCYRLWNPQDELSMKPYTEAEILRVELSEALLWLAFLGISDASQFSWYQAPPNRHLAAAKNLLLDLQLVKQGSLTNKARQILPWPLSVRAGCFLWEGLQGPWPSAAIDMTVILQEKDIWAKQYNLSSYQEAHENDLILRYEFFAQLRTQKSRPGFFHSLLKASQQLSRSVGSPSGTSETPPPAEVARWVLKSFPDRLCRRRSPQEKRALMATGRGVELEDSSLVKKSEFFVALQGLDLSDRETRINLACGLSKEQILKDLSEQIEKRRELKQENQKIWVEESRRYRQLPLDKPSIHPASSEELQALLPSLILSSWKSLVSTIPALEEWNTRWNYYVTQVEGLKPWSEETLRPVIEEACYGLKSWEEATQQDWIYFLENKLPPEVVKDFHQQVPKGLQAGERHLKIHYPENQDPYIESRIQHFYGLKKHPSIFQGRVALRLILLGPHGRPIQITKDLLGFWKSSYQEIRKEMKADYPKHSWPEDPSQG